MSQYIGKLVYEITGDTSGMARSLGEAKGSAGVFSTFMGGWAVKLAGIIGSAFAIQKLVDWNKKMLEAASAANETASRFGGTFATAIKKANAAVSDLTTQYGFSTQAAQDAMSATGGLVKTLGATDDQAATMAETVAKLGADMASYVNYTGGAKGAADALTRALLGETDAAKGLSLSLGDDSLKRYAQSLGKSIDSMNAVEKAQLRLNLAMSQASAMGAVGDMIKTAAGYANTLRSVESKIEDAEAKAGQRLLPAVTELTREFGNAIAPGGAFSGVLEDIADAGAGAASVLAGLLKKLNEVSVRKSIELMKEDVKSYETFSDQILRKYRGEKQLLEESAKSNNAAKYDLSKYNEYQSKLEQTKKTLKELMIQQDASERQAAKSELGEKARQQSSMYSNAYQEISNIETRYLSFTRNISDAQRKRINEIRQMTPEMLAAYKIPADVEGEERKYLTMLQETTRKAVAGIREIDAESAKLEKKFGVTVDFDTPSAPAKSVPRMGPTTGKTDLKGTIKTAQEAISAISKLNGETIALASRLNSLDDGQVKNVKESLEKASPAAQIFSEAFENIDISKLLSDIVDMGRGVITIEQLTDKWGDKLKKAGDSAAAIRVDKSAGPQIKSAIDQAGDAFTELKKKIADINDAMQTWGDAGLNVLSGMAAATAAYYDAKLAGLDAQMQAELEAAGVSDETAAEKAQREYDLAVKSGDQVAIAEKKKALTKAKIEEDFEKKKSALEYKAALRAWEYQAAIGAAQIPKAIAGAIATGMTQGGPWVAAAYAAIAATSEGLQYAAILEAKPKRANYAEGGVVPGSYYSGDNVQANVNSGEMILNAKQQKELWNAANGSGATGGATHIHFHVAGKEVQEVVLAGLYDATANGQAMVHPNGIAAR